MSLKSCMASLQALALPDGFPTANVGLWQAASWDAYPHCELMPAPGRRTVEIIRRLGHSRFETHWVSIRFYMSIDAAGSLEAAQDSCNTWVEAVKAKIRANPQLIDAGGNLGCLLCGETVDGRGLESGIGVGLDASVDKPIGYGELLVPVQDLEELT